MLAHVSETFRLAYVPGTTPGKWARVWRERLPDVPLDLLLVDAADAPTVLRDGRADAAVARLPVDTDVFSRIPLYDEVPVVCVSRDHLLAASEEDETVSAGDLADETVWLSRDDVLFSHEGGPPPPGMPPVDPDGNRWERPASDKEALAVVASGAGVTVLPMSLARLYHRKDVVFRRFEPGPTAPVGLVWPAGETTDLVEEMIGIVRGRTVNSSRGRARSRVADDGADARTGSGRARGGKAAKGTSGGASRGARGRPASSRNRNRNGNGNRRRGGRGTGRQG